jgi:hypothetical protein
LPDDDFGRVVKFSEVFHGSGIAGRAAAAAAATTTTTWGIEPTEHVAGRCTSIYSVELSSVLFCVLCFVFCVLCVVFFIRVFAFVCVCGVFAVFVFSSLLSYLILCLHLFVFSFSSLSSQLILFDLILPFLIVYCLTWSCLILFGLIPSNLFHQLDSVDFDDAQTDSPLIGALKSIEAALVRRASSPAKQLNNAFMGCIGAEQVCVVFFSMAVPYFPSVHGCRMSRPILLNM